MTVSRETLTKLIKPVVEALDLELWGVEYVAQGKTSTLRVYIEHPQGIGVEDCGRVSRQLSAQLDVEEPIRGEYILEVSSPGLDRPLYTLEQYERQTGETIDVMLRYPFEGRRKFKGLLVAVKTRDIVMVVDDHEYAFPFESVEKAKVVPRF